MSLSRRALLLGGMGLAVAGCGGGGTTLPIDPNNVTRVRPSITIRWGARSRALDGPAAAMIAEITVRSLLLPDLATTVTVGRTAVGAATDVASTQTYELPGALPVGQVELKVRFYDMPSNGIDSFRTLVAVAQGQVELKQGGASLPDIAVEGRIAHVALASNQQVPTKGRNDLSVSVVDTDGNLLALAPGSFFYEILEGDGSTLEYSPARSQPDVGSFYGLAPGTARVQVRVGNIVSAPTTVTVTNLPTIAPGVRFNYLDIAEFVWDPSRRCFWFVDRAITASNILRSLDPVTGELGKQITIPGGGFRQLTLTTDGSALYGYVSGTKSIRRITLDDGVLRDRIELPVGDFIPYAPPCFCLLPGAGNRLAVAGPPAPNDTSSGEVWIYEGERRLPGTLSALLGQVPPPVLSVHCNADGTLLSVQSMFSPSWQVGLGPKGFIEGTLRTFPAGQFNQDQLLDSEGHVYDAQSGALLSTLHLSAPDQFAHLAPNHSYLVFEGDFLSKRLRVLNKQSFTEQGRLELPSTLPSALNFTAPTNPTYQGGQSVIVWGDRGVALLTRAFESRGETYGLLVFDQLPGL